jgi:hypothetical protein
MRYLALLRMAVRSLMAQEKYMSAAQPHPFLLRSLYLNLLFLNPYTHEPALCAISPCFAWLFVR